MDFSDAYWRAAAPAVSAPYQHVTVIGAGIVGLTAAAALVRSGRAVTVMDAHGAVGQGTSLANGCQLSYGYVAPLAQPGLLAELPQLLLARHAPLKIVPRLQPAQWAWMLRFLRACTASQARQGSLELLALGALSRTETDLWLQGAAPDALSFTQSGKLVVLPDTGAFRKAQAQLALQAPHGPPQQALLPDECLRIEPALERFRERMAGAIYTPSECAVDSHALCQNLEARLRARGVRFALGTRVLGFRQSHGRVTHLQTDAGEREVDGVALATGAESAAVARQLGFSVPVYPLKGYSITASIRDPEAVPRASITDASKKVVYARVGQRLRVAGVAEIRGYDRHIDATRINELRQHTREAFGHAVDLESVSDWVGLRPATPTSVPIIARSPVRNVFLNIGHGALGLTLAFGSARQLAELMDQA